MILLDPRDGNGKQDVGASIQMCSTIRQLGVLCDRYQVDAADACFEGKGPQGNMLIGMERKTIHDMLKCIDDGRYNMQRIKMKQMYAKSFLLMEGMWKAHDEYGYLMEGFVNKDGKLSWAHCKPGGKPVMFSKLYNYLISVAHSGVIISYPQNLTQTCHHIVNTFHYHQKRWQDHTSLLDRQLLNIPTLVTKPKLIRKWAEDLEGVGVKTAIEAEKLFKRPIRLATADESDWLRLEGVGVATAQRIVREIGGYER